MSAMHGDCCLVNSDVIRPCPGGRALTIEDLIYLALNELLIPSMRCSRFDRIASTARKHTS